MALGPHGGKQGDESRRSPGGAGAPPGHFAMTTVYIPDRLDMQEARARAEEEEGQPRRRRRFAGSAAGGAGRPTRGVLLVALLAALGFFGYRVFSWVDDDLAAPRVAERLTQGLGQRVTVGQTVVEAGRALRLVLRDVELSGRLRIDEVRLSFTWVGVIRSVYSGDWAWNEAVVPSVDLAHTQVTALLDVLPRIMDRLPPSVSLVRAASIGFPDYSLLPGRHDLSLRRQEDGRLGPVLLESAASDGPLRMRLTPRAAGAVEFQADASRWRSLIGSGVVWTDLTATGYLGSHYLVVERFSAALLGGVIQGTAAAARDAEWVLTGTARASDLDLEAVFRQVQVAASAGSVPDTELRASLTGRATLDLWFLGRAATLSEAIQQMAFAGPVRVRSAQLNGISLGQVAIVGTRADGVAAGMTRFSQLDAMMVVAGQRVVLTGIAGRAGALSVRGEIAAGSDLALAGEVRVDRGVRQAAESVTLRVRGTALAPVLSR
jgi:hypothetical protein